MAEHRDDRPTRTEKMPPVTSTRRRLSRPRLPESGAGRTAAGLIATVISVITTVVVVILAVHILFVIFEANTSNDIVSTIGDWAENLAWQFKDVFEPEDAKFRVAVNYGLAAVVYLIIGRVLAGLIQRLG